MRPLLARTAALTAALSLGAAPGLGAPRVPGARPAVATPEGGLWDLSDKAEVQARQSAELETSPELNAYVRGVVCKVAPEYCGELRLYVLDRPYFNAAMAPNGYVEVWTGLLLRVDDEAELAFVLGHEASHFAQNHSLAAHEALKNRANMGLILAAGIGAAGVAAAASAPSAQSANSILRSTGDVAEIAYIGTLLSIFSFTREQEAEADQLGFKRAVAAGYRPSAGADLWRKVMAETSASDFDKVRKSEAQLSIFADHPASATRLAALQAQAAEVKTAGESGAERLRAAIRPHLAAWLKSDLRRRDYGETLYLLDHLAGYGQDLGVINFYRGEAYRLRRAEGDLALAAKAYAAAGAYDDAPPAAWRELGEMRRRDHDADGARQAYQLYLAKAPTADDAWMVQDSILSLAKGN